CPVLLHTSIFFLTLCRPPTSTLFPYTTLFRSGRQRRYGVIGLAHAHRHRYRDAAVDCLRRADRDHAVISTGRQTSRVDRNRNVRSEEHTSELQSRGHLVCRLLLEKKKKKKNTK